VFATNSQLVGRESWFDSSSAAGKSRLLDLGLMKALIVWNDTGFEMQPSEDKGRQKCKEGGC
jgi:hypothetical protein